MPYGTRCGVYDADLEEGTEVSSTYEGRHLTFYEDELTHPDHIADAFVDKGDPVIVGENIVGVAFKSALAASDLIAIDTEGIWNLSVVASDNSGGVQVDPGDQLFINKSTCILSKNASPETQIPFGYALGTIVSSQTAVIAVKVHWDPAQAFKYYCGATAYNEIRGYLSSGTPMQIFKCSGDQYRAIMQAINDGNDSDYLQYMALDGSRVQHIFKGTFQIEMVDMSAGAGAGAWLFSRGAEPAWVGAATPANMQIAGTGTGPILVATDDKDQTIVIFYTAATKTLTVRNLAGETGTIVLG